MKNCRKVGIKVHGDFIIGLPGETKDTIQKTIDYAKELDCETIQVSLAHAMPGTEIARHHGGARLLKVEALADSGGHQLPHIEYPHLSKVEMMSGVNRFYDEYYFRPKVVWRIVKEALWDSHERKRLYHEATEFLQLRAERLKWARKAAITTAHGFRTWSVFSFRKRLTPAKWRAKEDCDQDAGHGLGNGGVRQCGDLMLKRGMSQIGAVQLTASGLAQAFRLTVTNGTIWLGFSSDRLHAELHDGAELADYSYVMPAGAFGYALLTLLAVIFCMSRCHRGAGLVLS